MSRLTPIFMSLLVIAAAPLSASAHSDDPAPQVRVKTRSGAVEGALSQDKATISFKGLPFAAAPVGDLRWAAPVPPKSWAGIRPATQFAADCPQPLPPPAFRPSSLGRLDEDCLYLNVWKPAGPVKNLPVLVWIYGGSFIGGGTSDPSFDGANLARRGAVIVTVNYRTGALGYMAHPLLSKASPTHASGNYGVMDNIAALKWVQKNITAFGGDPKRVTVFGQSAGAVSVNMLMSSPKARGLFSRGIVQSGPIFGLTPAMRERHAVEGFGERFMAARGAKTLAEMRALPWQAFQMQTPEERKEILLPFAPIADGDVLPLTAAAAFAQGKQMPIPLIIGSTAQENSSSVPETYTVADFEAWVRQVYTDQADDVLALWPHGNDQEARASRVQLRAYAINEGSLTQARLHAQRQPETWLYRFDRVIPGPKSHLYGADHGADVAYTFGHLDRTMGKADSQDARLSEDLIAYWLNFATSANPNGPGLPDWPEFNDASATQMIFGDQRQSIQVPDLKRLGAARRSEDVQLVQRGK